MENIIVILVIVVSFLYKVYKNYQEEMEKSKKRNMSRPNPPVQEMQRSVPTVQEVQRSAPSIPTPPPIPEPKQTKVQQAPAPVLSRNEIPEEVLRAQRKNETKRKTIADELKQREAAIQHDDDLDFDLRKAVIQAAILERPYRN